MTKSPEAASAARGAGTRLASGDRKANMLALRVDASPHGSGIEVVVGIFSRIFGARRERAALDPLYRAIVAAARSPRWYTKGAVPDTLDGRFDMIAALLALVLIRLEAEDLREPSVLLTELFIEDMEASLRQIGIGDFVVGKHVGRMVGALGGRLASFRASLQAGEGLGEPVRRNIFHDAPPTGDAVGFVAAQLEDVHRTLAITPRDAIIGGKLLP